MFTLFQDTKMLIAIALMCLLPGGGIAMLSSMFALDDDHYLNILLPFAVDECIGMSVDDTSFIRYTCQSDGSLLKAKFSDASCSNLLHDEVWTKDVDTTPCGTPKYSCENTISDDDNLNYAFANIAFFSDDSCNNEKHTLMPLVIGCYCDSMTSSIKIECGDDDTSLISSINMFTDTTTCDSSVSTSTVMDDVSVCSPLLKTLDESNIYGIVQSCNPPPSNVNNAKTTGSGSESVGQAVTSESTNVNNDKQQDNQQDATGTIIKVVIFLAVICALCVCICYLRRWVHRQLTGGEEDEVSTKETSRPVSQRELTGTRTLSSGKYSTNLSKGTEPSAMSITPVSSKRDIV